MIFHSDSELHISEFDLLVTNQLLMNLISY